MKNLFIIVCLFSISIIGVNGQATLPIAPEIVSVSVKPLTDYVTINWNASPSPGVIGYAIHEHHYDTTSLWKDIFILSVYDSIARQISFAYQKVLTGPVTFFVAAIIPGPLYSPSVNYLYHRAIFTQARYDSCMYTCTVTWTQYEGWGNKFGSYTVFQMVNGGSPEIVMDQKFAGDTSLKIPVDPNKKYDFYVWATNSDNTVSSMSNSVTVNSNAPVPPSFIIADYASFDPNSSNPVKIKFSLDPNSALKNYQLYTSDNAGSGFKPVNAPIIATKDSIVILDNLTKPLPKYYRLNVQGICGNSVDSSNIATAMILNVTVQSNAINLSWNEYKGWDIGVQYYNIYRKIGNDDAQLIGNTATNNYTDNVSKFVGTSGYICYYVEAVSNRYNIGKVDRSLSSNFCNDFSGDIFIPNAFTPNGDTRNDIFRPSFAFTPKEYTMVIYNRYGFKLFEIKQQFHEVKNEDVNGWDGSIGGGKMAPLGTYVYFIKFSSQTGKTFEKKGNFSLIYP